MGTKERRKPQKPFSTLARLLRWLIGSSYLLVALLGLALLGEIARPLTTSKAGLPSGDPTTLIPIGLWTIIGIGILTRHAWGPGLAVILPLVTAYLAGHFGDGPFWFVAGSHSAWIVGERVPLQLILEPLVASGARTPLTAPANWLAYFVQCFLLLPECISIAHGSIMAIKASARRRLRRKTLVLPDELFNVYTENPYQVLGLRPEDATTREIGRRRTNIETLSEIGLPIEENQENYWSVGWEEQPIRDTNAATHAAAKLHDERSRFTEQLLWFHLKGEPEAILDALRSGDLDKARRAWTARTSKGGASPKQASALHNLAVLHHAQVLMAERASVTAGGRKPVIDQWKASLSWWKDEIASSECGKNIKRYTAKATDPRVNAEFRSQLVESLPRRVLSVNIDLAISAANQGFVEYAKSHLHLIKSSNYAATHIQWAIETFFAKDLNRARTLLRPLTAQTGELRADDEFKELVKSFPAIQKKFAEYREKSQLTELIEAALRSGKRRILHTINTAENRLNDAHMRCVRQNMAIIEGWNEMLSLYNSLPVGADQPALLGLHMMIDKLASAGSDLKDVTKEIKELAKVIDQLRPVVDYALNLARGIDHAEVEALEEIQTALKKSLSEAGSEFKKTEEHYNRNLNTMISSLAS